MIPKKRLGIPKAAMEAALGDFFHLCAACGEKKPQLHHIDGNPANNDPLNLIPLCPNHHLTDAHDPTRPIEPGRLRLLRLYRDPTVLDSRFQPIFTRLERLRERMKLELPTGTIPCNIRTEPRLDYTEWCPPIYSAAQDLWRFLAVFEKGAYYSRKFERIMNPTLVAGWLGDDSLVRGWFGGERMAVDGEIMLAEIEALILEMVRYQEWKIER